MHGLGAFLIVAQQVMVEELPAVGAVKAEQGEGQSRFDVLELGQRARRAAIPPGARFGPLAENVRQHERPEEITGQRLAAQRHGVGFHKARLGHVPVIGAKGDLLAQQRAGPGGRPPVRMPQARGRQQPIQRGRTGGQKFRAHVAGEFAVGGFIIRQPQRQRGGQPFAARRLRRQPAGLQRGQMRRAINGRSTGHAEEASRRRAVQHPDG